MTLQYQLALLFLVLFCSLGAVQAQESSVLEVDTSGKQYEYWILPTDYDPIVLTLPGGFIKTEMAQLVIYKDDHPIQALKLHRSQLEEPGDTDMEILIRQASNETAYQQDMIGQPLDLQMLEAPLSSEESVLVWWWEMPPRVSPEVTAQVGVNRMLGDYALMLVCPQFKDGNLQDVQNLLMDIISTAQVLPMRQLEMDLNIEVD